MTLDIRLDIVMNWISFLDSKKMCCYGTNYNGTNFALISFEFPSEN